MTIARPKEIENLPLSVPRPVGYRLVIKPLKPKERTTESGLVIPDQVTEAMKFLQPVGQVVAMGPDCYADRDKFPNGPYCDVGDFVIINPYDGQNVEVKHHPQDKEHTSYKIVYDDKVVSKVNDPEAIKVYCD